MALFGGVQATTITQTKQSRDSRRLEASKSRCSPSFLSHRTIQSGVHVWFLTNLMIATRLVCKQVKDGKACDRDVLAWRDAVRSEKAGATSEQQQ